MKSFSSRNATIAALSVLFFLFQGCWIPSAIWQSGNPYNLPDWPEKPDKDHIMPAFKVGDRFVLAKPLFLEKNSIIKPPYCLTDLKSGVAEQIGVIPAGTVIRIVALKDGTVSGSGVDEYIVIEGMEELGWVFIAGEPQLRTKNGTNFYEFDENLLRSAKTTGHFR